MSYPIFNPSAKLTLAPLYFLQPPPPPHSTPKIPQLDYCNHIHICLPAPTLSSLQSNLSGPRVISLNHKVILSPWLRILHWLLGVQASIPTMTTEVLRAQVAAPYPLISSSPSSILSDNGLYSKQAPASLCFQQLFLLPVTLLVTGDSPL